MHPSGYKISAGFQSRQVTFAGCNQSEANVRKISDTAALSQNVRNFPDVIDVIEVERNFADKKEKSILDFPTKSVQKTLTVLILYPKKKHPAANLIYYLCVYLTTAFWQDKNLVLKSILKEFLLYEYLEA